MVSLYCAVSPPLSIHTFGWARGSSVFISGALTRCSQVLMSWHAYQQRWVLKWQRSIWPGQAATLPLCIIQLYIYIYIRGATIQKFHGSVRFDTLVSRFDTFSIRFRYKKEMFLSFLTYSLLKLSTLISIPQQIRSFNVILVLYIHTYCILL